jgi:hypothetical protein
MVSRTTLRSFLRQYEHETFEWGRTDCIHFVARWLEYNSIPLFDAFDEWDYSDVKTARSSYVKFLKKHKARSITDVLDQNYCRVSHIPMSGGIVAKRSNSTFGRALGIVEGSRGLFMDWDGVKSLPLDPDKDLYWWINDE